jgi:plasmid stability protein
MPRIVQIRNVPDRLHVVLKERAAGAGQSLSDYVVSQLERAAEKSSRTPSVRVISGPRVKVRTPVAAILKRIRGS